MNTVIYHSADFDGKFCREIARKFLGDRETQFVGWNYGEPVVPMPREGRVYILDLNPECLGDNPGLTEEDQPWGRVVWIDHHKTAIEKWPGAITGYRMDGVAACRLAWQWFSVQEHNAQAVRNDMVMVDLPCKEEFVDRAVDEPLAVQLAGEYDVWDRRNPAAEVFQHGLRSRDLDGCWPTLLSMDEGAHRLVAELLERGDAVQYAQRQQDAGVVNYRSFLVEWEGLRFLALTTARCNSLTFAAKDKPETGHDALMGFCFNGREWIVSLYHAQHRTGLDLSAIAKRHGGGGHRGACGFQCRELPFGLGKETANRR